MRTSASRGSRTPWHPACSRRETSRIVHIHEPMPPHMPHRGREPHPLCTSQDSAGETCLHLRDVPMPPPHLQTMCWPLPTWIPVLVSRSSNPGMDPLPDSDGQVFVFHFPGVIQRVIRGVPNQIPQRPSSGHFALSMERPNGVAIGVAVRLQTLVDQHRTLGRGEPRPSLPTLAPRESYDGRCDPDHALPLADTSRIWADTRKRTSSKNAQHACIRVSSRSNSPLDRSCLSMLENANEMPQKSVEPVPG